MTLGTIHVFIRNVKCLSFIHIFVIDNHLKREAIKAEIGIVLKAYESDGFYMKVKVMGLNQDKDLTSNSYFSYFFLFLYASKDYYVEYFIVNK